MPGVLLFRRIAVDLNVSHLLSYREPRMLFTESSTTLKVPSHVSYFVLKQLSHRARFFDDFFEGNSISSVKIHL